MHAVVSTASLRGNVKASTPVPADEALIQSIANGDKPAMKILFERHNVRVFRFILRLTGDRAVAEDVVSDVFFDVWRTAASFEGRCQVSTWLLSIARYKAFATLRKRGTEPLDENLAGSIADPADGPETAVNSAQQVAILRRCLMGLPRPDRELLDLAYYHEKTMGEIAQIVGIPSGTVKSRLFAARRRVAELLARSGLTSYHGGAGANAR